MPFLFSQLVVKRFLYTVAVLNTALLGVCAYLFLAPSSGGSGTVPVFTASKSFAPASAIPDQPGLAGAAFQPRSIQPAPDSVPGREPAARVVLAASVSGEPDGRPAQPGRVTDSWSSDPEENSVHDSGPVMLAPTILEAATSTQSAVHIGSASFAAAVTSPAAASDVRAPAVPLAFTTSANGATPSQAAALGRLQQGFVNDLGGQNQNPNTPAYAQSWQAAQALSDSNYAQQFGWQAFVQAQLAQVHGGAQ
jgi:hypothetical protein